MDIQISIVGLGYIGCISVGCISKMGYKVIGVDNNEIKVNLIKQGQATIIENDINPIISEGLNKGLISATSDIYSAVRDSNVTFICVNTPNTKEGDLDHTQIYNVAKDIGKAIRIKNSLHTVLIRSTVAPGTGKIIEDLIEKYSNKLKGKDFDVIANPEFMREGVAVEDFFNPGMTVLGITNDTTPLSLEILSKLYEDIDAPIYKVKRETSEAIKYINNSWHAVKISFTNEISRICNSLNIDPFEVMELFCNDEKLNISKKYLLPGFAYGGSCLPKDILGLTSLAKKNGVDTPLLNGTIMTNNILIDQAYEMIVASEYKKIAFVGLAFKDGTDDLRGSPLLILAQKLEKLDVEIDYYDKNVSGSIFNEINKNFIKKELGSIYHRLHDSVPSSISGKNLVIVGSLVDGNLFLGSKLQIVIDLVNGVNKNIIINAGIQYRGLNWK
jgi:GDP-mannose 6-dehydrogenase